MHPSPPWASDPLPSVLIVDDDPGIITVLGQVLAGCAQLRFATQGADALRLARLHPPDLVLLDVEMPGLGGFEVCAQFKADALLNEVPVIFLTSHADEAQEIHGLTLGAADFISKPIRAARVRARVLSQLQLKRMTDQLRRAAVVDGLTQVANRRQFDLSLPREWLRAQRNGRPLSLLMLDLDHFKGYNDALGHPQGDACLRQVAAALQALARRPADLLARYGGEEFVLLLPDTDEAGAAALARQVLQAVADLALPHPASQVGPWVSVSVGVATERPAQAAGRDEGTRLLSCADQALYRAKQAGRAQMQAAPATDADGLQP